jgi:hypothetical protein
VNIETNITIKYLDAGGRVLTIAYFLPESSAPSSSSPSFAGLTVGSPGVHDENIAARTASRLPCMMSRDSLIRALGRDMPRRAVVGPAELAFDTRANIT